MKTNLIALTTNEVA